MVLIPEMVIGTSAELANAGYCLNPADSSDSATINSRQSGRTISYSFQHLDIISQTPYVQETGVVTCRLCVNLLRCLARLNWFDYAENPDPLKLSKCFQQFSPTWCFLVVFRLSTRKQLSLQHLFEICENFYCAADIC